MPQLLVTTPVTLTVLSSYFSGWSLSSEIRTPRAAQPVTSSALKSATDRILIVTTPAFLFTRRRRTVSSLHADWRNAVARGSWKSCQGPECGDASACLKLRIPVIRRDRTEDVQDACP